MKLNSLLLKTVECRITESKMAGGLLIKNIITKKTKYKKTAYRYGSNLCRKIHNFLKKTIYGPNIWNKWNSSLLKTIDYHLKTKKTSFGLTNKDKITRKAKCMKNAFCNGNNLCRNIRSNFWKKIYGKNSWKK